MKNENFLLTWESRRIGVDKDVLIVTKWYNIWTPFCTQDLEPKKREKKKLKRRSLHE